MSLFTDPLRILRDNHLVSDHLELFWVLNGVHEGAVLKFVFWRLWAELYHHYSDLQLCATSVGNDFIGVTVTLLDFAG